MNILALIALGSAAGERDQLECTRCRLVLESFNPDVLEVVPSASQQRAEVLEARFLRRLTEQIQPDERSAAPRRIWSRLTRGALLHSR
jgi:hypothetical protein